MVTLKDIAEKAKVSTMTVSRVVKNPEMVNIKTRLKVEAVINELNYQPNANARRLVLQKTNTILIIIPDISNFFFSEMIESSSQILKQYGYNVIFANSYGFENEEKRLIEMGLSKIVDGIILYVPRSNSNYLDQTGKNIPIVVIDRQFESDSVGQIYIDNLEGARKGVQYMLSMGHRRIGLIEGPEEVQVNYRRKLGYIKALEEQGIDYDEELIFKGDFSFTEGRVAYNYFSKLDNPPTALFATNDVMALGFIQKAQENGVNIPDDYSILGFDNIRMGNMIVPALTTVNHPKRRMGKMAAYKILELLGEKITNMETVELTNDLIFRNSIKYLEKKEE